MIVALSESISQPGHFALVLEEPVSRRRIPLIIGSHEAQAIAISLENLEPARPLTHDLFQRTLQTLGITLEEVLITRFDAEVFFAQLVLKDHASQRLFVDARPSDAIALAVRFGCPLYTTADILAVAAYETDEQNWESQSAYLEFTLQELEDLLRTALKREEYERAARVRDALERRKRAE
nr:bifunctional nuclease family protein [Hymenobacter terricola]